MLQVTGTGRLNIDHERIPYMRDEFKERCLLRLPGFIEESMLKAILKHLDNAQASKGRYFSDRTGLPIGEELTVDSSSHALSIMCMLLNNPALFQIMEQISGATPLRVFMGRMYTLLPKSDHQIVWHDDKTNHRRLGVSINFSREPFEGGVLQLREKSTQKLLSEYANTGLGDAVIFRISSKIEHSTTRVGGSVKRTTGAGWFHSQPDFHTLLNIPNFPKS